MIRSEQISSLQGINHGFLTRAGGVSRGAYSSLNCGHTNGDDAHRVEENRKRALASVDPHAETLCTARQVHGDQVVAIETPWSGDRAPEADGLVTIRPGVALGITTADCAPVLIADQSAAVIGATHAGWRGALAGVIEATVAAMMGLGSNPASMVAAIGPCIAKQSYQVGPEFLAPFLQQDADNRRFFETDDSPGRHRFDLPGYVRSRLEKSGVHSADIIGADTCTDEDRFFSYRRACQRGERAFGLGISIISLN